MKNNRLILLFFGLLLVVAAVWYYDAQSGDSTFDRNIIKIDSASIDRIAVKHPKSAEPILLTKQGGTWFVKSGDGSYRTDSMMVASMLHRFSTVDADRLVAREQVKWKEYEVTDSLATRVTFYASDRVAADILLGRFSYAPKQGSTPNGGGGFTVTTFVRLADAPEVYAVNDFLKAGFPARPDDYRNKLLVRIDKQLVSKIEFSYPADSSFTLNKLENGWYINDQQADTLRIDSYLNMLGYLTGQDFLNHFSSDGPETSAPFEISVHLQDGSSLALYARPVAGRAGYAVGSSVLGRDVWFDGNSGGLFDRLFVSRAGFNPDQESKKGK